MIEIDFKKINTKILRSLPHRKWDEVKSYDHLYILSSGKKHDSGYSLINVIGAEWRDKKLFAEIAATCDDIGWSFPTKHPYDRIEAGVHRMMIRTDCLYPSGIIRMWASGEHYFNGKFEVGINTSSTDITLKIVPKGDGVNKVTGERII